MVSLAEQAEKIRRALQKGEIQKVLFVGPSRIGDILFNTPALRHFKKTYPEVRSFYLSSKYAQDVLKYNPHLDGVLAYHKEAPRLFRWWEKRRVRKQILEEKFDLVVFFNMGRKVLPLFEGLSIPWMYPPSPESFPALEEFKHAVEKAFHLVKPLGIEASEPGPMEIFFTEREEGRVDNFLREKGIKEPFAVFHPGCYRSFAKRFFLGSVKRLWPAEYFAKLAEKLWQEKKMAVLISVAGRGEVKLGRQIQRRAKALVELAPLSILELAALLRRAALMVTGDTGPLHIAACVGTPTVALFGPTPWERTRPFGTGPSVCLFKGLPCSPCRGKGIRCYDNRCMKEISVEEVWQASNTVLRERVTYEL